MPVDSSYLKRCEVRLIWVFPDENGEIAEIIKKHSGDKRGLPPIDFTHFEVGANFNTSYQYLHLLNIPNDICKKILGDDGDDKDSAEICLVSLSNGLISLHLRAFFNQMEQGGGEQEKKGKGETKEENILNKVRNCVSGWFSGNDTSRNDPGKVVAGYLRQEGLLPSPTDSFLMGAKPFYLVRIPLENQKDQGDQMKQEEQNQLIEAICGLQEGVSLDPATGDNWPELPVKNAVHVKFFGHCIQVWSRGLMENGVVHWGDVSKMDDSGKEKLWTFISWQMNRLANIVSNNLAAIVLARWVRHILANDGLLTQPSASLTQRSKRLQQLEHGMRTYFEHHIQIGSLLATGLPQDTREAIDSIVTDAGRRLDAAWSQLLFDTLRAYSNISRTSTTERLQ